jgi:hypothetical protein
MGFTGQRLELERGNRSRVCTLYRTLHIECHLSSSLKFRVCARACIQLSPVPQKVSDALDSAVLACLLHAGCKRSMPCCTRNH